MTEKGIVGKLRATLSSAVDSECKVVYVLAESRKLLESYPPDPVPFALKLYCHWALHIDLDQPKTTLPFLDRVEEYVTRVLAGTSDGNHEFAMLKEFIFLDTFRQQFKQFLSAYKLPTDVCDVDASWYEFLKHYAGVIHDGSLSCSIKARPQSLIEKVIIAKGDDLVDAADFFIPFGLVWTILLRDGRKLTIVVKGGAKDGKVTLSSSTSFR